MAARPLPNPDDDYPPIDTTKIIDDLCFERDVLPILQSTCAMSGCHDAETAAHEVVLDSWESIMNSEEDLVTPFDPRESELWEVLVEDGRRRTHAATTNGGTHRAPDRHHSPVDPGGCSQ